MGKVWTKDAEREQLRKIAELIEETECGSYIRMAFAGCVKMAEENIEFDFANSYPDQIDFKDKQNAEMGDRLLKLEHNCDAMSETIKAKDAEIEKLGHMLESKKIEAEKWEQNAHEAGELYCELEKECKQKDAEIIRLRAEIVRMRLSMMTDKGYAELYECVKGVE